MFELPRTSGVVLDLDDTLFPERSFHESGFRWIATKTSMDPSGPEVQSASKALRTGGRPLDILSQASGIPLETIIRWHREHPPDICLYPDASRFLVQLGAAGIPVVILTDGRSTTQRHKLEALGLTNKVRAVLISEEAGVSKADPRSFQAAAAHLRDRQPLVYVGDNPRKDLAIPADLGWTVLLLLDRGDNVHPQGLCESPYGISHAIATFDDIRVAPVLPR